MALQFATLLLPIVGAVSVSERTTPVLLWSGNSHFSGHITVSQPQQTNHIEEVARDIVSKSPRKLNPEYYSRISPPEVFVSVTFKKASNKYIADFIGSFQSKTASVLQDLVQGSTSSLVFPRVSLGDSFSSFASLVTPYLSKKASTVQYELDSTTESCNALLSALQDKEMYGNKRTDLVNVAITENDKRANELCLQRIHSEISDLSHGKFVMMLAADNTPSVQMMYPDASAAAAESANFISMGHHHSARSHLQSSLGTTNSSSSNLPGTGTIQYITPVMLIGILFALMMLGFVMVGVQALMSIYVPVRFQKSKFKIGKIY